MSISALITSHTRQHCSFCKGPLSDGEDIVALLRTHIMFSPEGYENDPEERWIVDLDWTEDHLVHTDCLTRRIGDLFKR